MFRAGILQSDPHSWRYLWNFSEFKKCARLESVVFGMWFSKKELHYRLQSKHLRKLFGVNVANSRFLEISRRTTFWNTPVFDRVVQCRKFSYYFTKKRFRWRSSPSNFAKLENSQEIFPVEPVFSIVIDSNLDSDLYPLKTFFWKFFMTCSFYRLVESR